MCRHSTTEHLELFPTGMQTLFQSALEKLWEISSIVIPAADQRTVLKSSFTFLHQQHEHRAAFSTIIIIIINTNMIYLGCHHW